MGRGFEFTDDAYYLLWDSNPFIYSWSQSQFGYVWHGLYELAGGDIKLFRLAGAAVLGGCAFIFGCALRSFLAPRLRPGFDIALVLAVMTASLWNFVFWIPSPGYNQLNLCGLLLLLAGLVSFASIGSGPSVSFTSAIKVAGAAAIAAAGWCICALAKPSTAVAVMLAGIVWILVLRPAKALAFAAVTIVLACAFMLAAIIAIDGSVAAFLERNIAALRILSMVGSYRLIDIWNGAVGPLIDIATDPLQRRETLAILIAGALWMVAVSWTRGRLGSWTVAFPLAVVVGLAHAGDPADREYHLSLVLPLVLLVAFAVAASIAMLRSRDPDRRRYGALVCLLAVTPFCYSIGTNTPLIYHASAAAVFWFAAMFGVAVLAAPANRDYCTSAVKSACGLLTAGMLIGALANPYRLESPIWNQDQPVQVGPRAAPLLVDRLTANYISVLRQAAQTRGFEPGTPVIDLTGEAPGTVFALGGEAPGGPWLPGGYPGSEAVAREILGRVPPQTLKRAWILTDIREGAGLPRSTLAAFGLNFPTGYDEVARARFVRNGGHLLWKPASPGP
jgi:uncharacterized membrane protein YhaH (DUF805 family)